MIARTIISALAGALLAGPALACSPAPMDAGTMARDGRCGVTYYDDEYTARSISDAEDVGAGQVVQYVFEGNACYGTVSMIVADCAAGQAAIFGPGPTEGPMDPLPAGDPWKVLVDKVLARASAGGPMPLDDILARAKGRFTNAAVVAIPAKVGISNDHAAPKHSFDLGCGCRAYHPGSAGAGS